MDRLSKWRLEYSSEARSITLIFGEMCERGGGVSSDMDGEVPL